MSFIFTFYTILRWKLSDWKFLTNSAKDIKRMTNGTSSNATMTSPTPSGCTRLFTPTEEWLQVSSFLIIIFLSIIGNAVVIIIIKKKRHMHTPTNYFIVNLCTVNLLILLLNAVPDIQGRIAPHLGFVVSGKNSSWCMSI